MTTEHDRYEDQPQGTQILWGRVLVLLLALALAFWLGTTFGGDGPAQQELTAQRNEIARLEAQIATMEAELAAVDAGGMPSEDAAGDAASEAAVDADTTAQRDDASDAPSENGQQRRGDAQERDQRYVIQSGDSLASIAQEVYGDPTRWREIARANNLEEPYALTVGASLRIPDAP
ncbi:MAG TPA: LysM peptidoglycan-binding domain-containing protein [Euzebyales bacterium]|nr:LysM peptidoglycan-binding domain-containing protein [Euzebyales bacterium]